MIVYIKVLKKVIHAHLQIQLKIKHSTLKKMLLYSCVNDDPTDPSGLCNKYGDRNKTTIGKTINITKNESKNNKILQTLFPTPQHGCEAAGELELTRFLSLIFHYKPNVKSNKRIGLSNFIKYFIHLCKIEEIRIKIDILIKLT